MLAATSAAQLGCGIAGMAVALRRRHAYDFLFLHGRRESIARDSVLMGTALSAPVTMLTAQAVATVLSRRRHSRYPDLVLGALGATMVGGYLGERLVRLRLSRSGWDAVESPLVVAGLGLAAAMAAGCWAGPCRSPG